MTTPPDFFFRVDFTVEQISDLMDLLRWSEQPRAYTCPLSGDRIDALLDKLETTGGRRPKTGSSCPMCGAYDYGNISCLACVETWEPTIGTQELRQMLREKAGRT